MPGVRCGRPGEARVVRPDAGVDDADHDAACPARCGPPCRGPDAVRARRGRAGSRELLPTTGAAAALGRTRSTCCLVLRSTSVTPGVARSLPDLVAGQRRGEAVQRGRVAVEHRRVAERVHAPGPARRSAGRCTAVTAGRVRSKRAPPVGRVRGVRRGGRGGQRHDVHAGGRRPERVRGGARGRGGARSGGQAGREQRRPGDQRGGTPHEVRSGDTGPPLCERSGGAGAARPPSSQGPQAASTGTSTYAHPMPDPAPLVVGFDLDMTLIDTRPGFAATLAVLAEETGVALDVEELSEPARAAARPACSRRTTRPRSSPRPGRPVPRALPRRTRSRRPRRSPARTRPWPPYAATAAAASWCTGKYAPNAALHVDHLGLDVDHLVGEVWGVGKARGAAPSTARRVYVGDHVHDVEGARAAGALSVSVLTGGCTERGARARRHRRRARRPDRSSRPGSTTTCSTPRLAALEERAARRSARCWSPSAAARTARSCWPRRCGRSAPSGSAPRPRYSDSLPQAERDPARDFADGPRRAGAHPGDPRDGARGLPRQRRRPLLLLQGRAARRARPAGRRARVRRTSRPAPTPTTPCAGFRPGIRAAAERGAVTPLRDAGLTKEQVRRGLAALGPADLGQAGGGLPVQPGRLRHRGHARSGWPGSSGPRPRCGPRWPRPGSTCATCGSATWATGPGSRSTPTGVAAVDGQRRRCSTAVRAAGFDEAEVDPRGFRSGSMNELLPDPERFR